MPWNTTFIIENGKARQAHPQLELRFVDLTFYGTREDFDLYAGTPPPREFVIAFVSGDELYGFLTSFLSVNIMRPYITTTCGYLEKTTLSNQEKSVLLAAVKRLSFNAWRLSPPSFKAAFKLKRKEIRK